MDEIARIFTALHYRWRTAGARPIIGISVTQITQNTTTLSFLLGDIYMKVLRHSLLAMAVAAPALAQAEDFTPNFYGRADISINNTDTEADGTTVTTSSNASRIGIHNSHAIDEGLSVFYRLEYEVNWDERHKSGDDKSDNADIDGQTLRNRNSIVGLKGGWGSVFVGIHDTPLKKAEQKVDLFSDVFNSDIDNVLEGQQRLSDTISYKTPKAAGLQGWVMLIPGEGEKNSGSDALGAPNDDGVADAVSASITYETKPVSLALAYETDVKDRDIVRLSAQHKSGPLQLGALAQIAENSDGTGTDGLGYVLSVGYKVSDKNTLKLQFTSADDESVEESAGSDMVSLGLDRKLGKSTKLYFFVTDRSNDDNAAEEYTSAGIGIQHKFGKDK